MIACLLGDMIPDAAHYTTLADTSLTCQCHYHSPSKHPLYAVGITYSIQYFLFHTSKTLGKNIIFVSHEKNFPQKYAFCFS